MKPSKIFETHFDTKLLRKFLKLAGDQIEGSFVLLGGNVLPLLDINFRTTTDIDLAPVSKELNNDLTLALMTLAEKLNFPVESINMAAAFFLYKIPKFQSQLILIHSGAKSIFYRPDVNLFLQLKMNRLSETDLEDCLQFIAYAKKNDEKIKKNHVLKLLKSRFAAADNLEYRRRLRKLQEAVEKGI